MKNKIEIDINSLPALSEEQIRLLKDLEERPEVFDKDNPPLTKEQLAKFKSLSEAGRQKRRKETVSLRLSPRALNKAKSLGKGYTAVLSRILEEALEDNDLIERYL